MQTNTRRAPVMAGLVLALGLSVAPAQAATDCGVCDTDAAMSVREARDQGLSNLGASLQYSLDRTVGVPLGDAVSGSCIDNLMSGGLGAQISLPTLSGVLQGIAEDALEDLVDQFCSHIDPAIDRIEGGIDDIEGVADDAAGEVGGDVDIDTRSGSRTSVQYGDTVYRPQTSGSNNGGGVLDGLYR